MDQRAVETIMKGTKTFHKSNAPIRNGEKVVTKHRTQLGSKLFKLAMFPSPKKDRSVRNSCKDHQVINIHINDRETSHTKKYERRICCHGDGRLMLDSRLTQTAAVAMRKT